MRRLSMFAALGVLAVTATTYAAPAKPREAWASGKLDRFDATAKSVVVKQGAHEMTFTLAPDAHLMQGKKSLQPSDLTADIGRQVKIRYTSNGSTMVADRIEVTGTTPAQASNAPTKH